MAAKGATLGKEPKGPKGTPKGHELRESQTRDNRGPLAKVKNVERVARVPFTAWNLLVFETESKLLGQLTRTHRS